MQFGAYCWCSLYVIWGTWLLHSQISDYYELFFLSCFFYRVGVLFSTVFLLIHTGIRSSAHARGEPCLNCLCPRLISAPTISCTPPPSPPPPPPALLPPLARCLVRPTIVYSVPSRASGDTPSAKATVRGEIVGRGPAERDTQPILVWEHRSYINSRGKIVGFLFFF